MHDLPFFSFNFFHNLGVISSAFYSLPCTKYLLLQYIIKTNNQLANVIIFKGATIALLAAVQKPGLFQGLVLSGTVLLPSGGPPSFLRVRLQFNSYTLGRIKSDIESN